MGHGRILAARRPGLTVFLVIVLDYLTETEARERRIADNQIAENSSWDEVLLSEELAALLGRRRSIWKPWDLTRFELEQLRSTPTLVELPRMRFPSRPRA